MLGPMLQKTQAQVPYSPDIPIGILKYLPHKGNWQGLRKWEDLGVRRLGDLFREGILLPFEELRTEFELPQRDFLLHGAVTAIIRTHCR